MTKFTISNADSVPSMRDMIDLSPVGITHPDQLIWYPSENGYIYNYLLIEDNNGDSTDVAGGINLREDRLWSNFSLTDNIIYADGQTTYSVYRRIVGDSAFTLIESGITDSSYYDRTVLQTHLAYEYVVTSTDMFGESAFSDSVIAQATILEAATPSGASLQVAGDDSRELSWGAAAGHGLQTGLITESSYDFSGMVDGYGVDNKDWVIGSSIESRRETATEATRYRSSFGVDLLSFNTSSGPDANRDIYTMDSLAHTPLPFDPTYTGNSRFDVIYFFNADSTTPEMDMIDLSQVGVTHPDQLEWRNVGTYSLLIIHTHHANDVYVAGGVSFRNNRFFGTFSLIDNIIYADGQTTYNVYRRVAGDSTYQMLASGLTDTTYTDTETLNYNTTYEYAFSSVDMFGESALSDPISMQTGGNPFPVEWAGFEVAAIGHNEAKLNWETASEQQSAYFEVERSMDGEEFSGIGIVAAAGSSEIGEAYQFVDQDVPAQRVYYRLRQVDLDGQYEFSQVRSLAMNGPAAAVLTPYPNPAKESFQIGGLMESEAYAIQFLSLEGRVVSKQIAQSDLGGALTLSTDGLPAGYYLLQVSPLGGGASRVAKVKIL